MSIMEIKNFEQVQTEIQAFYQESQWAEALELATEYAGTFPEHTSLFYYWRVCMAARLDQPGLSMSLLDEALDQGVWYGEVLLRKSPSLLELQGQPAYERLIEKNNQLHSAELEQIYPLLTIRPQQECKYGEHPCPVLFGLHANGSTAQASVNFWKAAASAGWLVAVPQSSQAMWKGSYIWDDLEITEREIKIHFQSIFERYSIENERVILAGHSMGGEVAIWLALTGAVPAQGFIALGPAGPKLDQPDTWLPEIATARAHLAHPGNPLRGYFVIGENDTSIPLPGIQDLARMLLQSGIECEIETLSEIGHEFSPEYEEALLRGIDYIENH